MNICRRVVLKECNTHDSTANGQRSLFFDVITYYPDALFITRNVHLICDETNDNISGDIIECGLWHDLNEDECHEYFQIVIDEVNRWVGAC